MIDEIANLGCTMDGFQTWGRNFLFQVWHILDDDFEEVFLPRFIISNYFYFSYHVCIRNDIDKITLSGSDGDNSSYNNVD